MNSTSRPQVRANSASHLRTPQYRTRETSTWSPGSGDWKTAVAAAIPEPNSAQAGRPSPRSAPRTPPAKRHLLSPGARHTLGQAGGCRSPNRLPNGSSTWQSRSPVMIVFGPRCALAPCSLH